MWAWDPVHLAELQPPADEYDCIVAPLSGWLRARLEPTEVASRLTRFVGDHFGTAPVESQAFAADTIAWYRTVDPATE